MILCQTVQSAGLSSTSLAIEDDPLPTDSPMARQLPGQILDGNQVFRHTELIFNSIDLVFLNMHTLTYFLLRSIDLYFQVCRGGTRSPASNAALTI